MNHSENSGKHFDKTGYEQQLAGFETLKQQAQTVADLYETTRLPPLHDIAEFSRLFADYEQLLFEKWIAAGNWPHIAHVDELATLADLQPLCEVLAGARAESHKAALRHAADPVLHSFNTNTPQECRMAEACKVLFVFEGGRVLLHPKMLEGLQACFTKR